MNIIATHINYYFICKRKLWLFANGISMEHTSDTVYEGKMLHETSYPQRPERYEELEIEGCKIDFYDARNKVVHEIKKSDKMEEAHEWQVKYYIWLLKRNGVEGVTGLLEYPKLRETTKVTLTEVDIDYLQGVVKEVETIMESEACPPSIKSKICKSCSYMEFCYVGEGGDE